MTFGLSDPASEKGRKSRVYKRRARKRGLNKNVSLFKPKKRLSMCINLLNLVVTFFVEFCLWWDSTHMVLSLPLWRGQSDHRAEMSLKHVCVIMELGCHDSTVLFISFSLFQWNMIVAFLDERISLDLMLSVMSYL